MDGGGQSSAKDAEELAEQQAAELKKEQDQRAASLEKKNITQVKRGRFGGGGTIFDQLTGSNQTFG